MDRPQCDPQPGNAPKLAHVSDWIFDLDNTLYPAQCDLFAQIDRRMTEFVSGFLNLTPDEARRVQKRYYAEHGTTLNGLMARHGMAPDAFLAHVHDIDLSPLPRCQVLKAALAALPGRRFVYTNGSKRHAERVTRHMGLDHLFDGMFGIEDAAFAPKPHPQSYDRFCDLHGVEPGRSAFFEDLARNLEPAHAMGFTTVLVHSDKDWSDEPPEARPAAADAARGDVPAHIHYVTGNLTGFLQAALPASPPEE